MPKKKPKGQPHGRVCAECFGLKSGYQPFFCNPCGSKLFGGIDWRTNFEHFKYSERAKNTRPPTRRRNDGTATS